MPYYRRLSGILRPRIPPRRVGVVHILDWHSCSSSVDYGQRHFGPHLRPGILQIDAGNREPRPHFWYRYAQLLQ